MLEKIKISLRLCHNVLDSDITTNIEACMLDLKRVGVGENLANSSSTDPMIQKAAELFCKWQYDFNGKGDQYNRAYEKLRDALSLCGDYAESVNADV